uniref:SAM50-like protein gop-3 n=1 Tax=Ascaris suum TaxID=6253 RepID=F1L426_ASCSU
MIEENFTASRLNMTSKGKLYHRADVLLGKCDDTPTVVEAVQFHGVHFTKNDALVKEVAYLYKSSSLAELIKNSNLACKHLQEVGLMENATALIDTVESDPNSYVVNFVVKEPKSFTLGLKAGVTTHGEADMMFNAGRQSFGGRGEAVNASFSYTMKGDKCFDIAVSKPFLGWQKYSNVSFALYRSLASLPWNHCDTQENGILFQYNGQLWAKKLLHTIKLNAVWRKLEALPEAAFAVREHAGHTLKCSLENSVAYDTRNRTLIPSKGILLRLAQEYAGLLGDAAFVKHQLDMQAAAPLFLGTFLSASLQCSLLSSLADRSLHVLDRLYLGGSHNVRGFQWNTIGPRIETSSLGGAASCVGVLHIYRPLIPAEMLFAHLFVASGALASVRSRHRLRDMSDAPRVSAGIGLALVFRNLIRLELNYVVPLRYAPGDFCSPGLYFGAGVNFL